MSSLDDMRRELRAKFERLKKARRETMLRYYEPLPSPPPLVPRREEMLPPLKRKEASNPDLERYLVENIEDYAGQLIAMPEVRRKLEREIADMERLLKRAYPKRGSSNPQDLHFKSEEEMWSKGYIA